MGLSHHVCYLLSLVARWLFINEAVWKQHRYKICEDLPTATSQIGGELKTHYKMVRNVGRAKHFWRIRSVEKPD
jgi:hypothetical protein